MTNGLPPLDGTYIDWNQYPVERWKSAVLWVFLVVAVVIVIKKIDKKKAALIMGRVSGCISLILLITIVTLCVTTQGYIKKPNLAVSDKNQFMLSEDVNFIILVIDALSGDTWESVYEIHPEYAETFQNFTFYDNVVGHILLPNIRYRLFCQESGMRTKCLTKSIQRRYIWKILFLID